MVIVKSRKVIINEVHEEMKPCIVMCSSQHDFLHAHIMAAKDKF
jgi:hypothetical protein